MKKGFELLMTRNWNDRINIEEIQIKNNIQLPPIFKLFIETFELDYEKIERDKLIKEGEKFPYYLSDFIYEPDKNINFAGFNSIETIIKIKEDDEDWVKNKYLPIGYCSFNGGLLVGTIGENIDKIILHDYEREPYFRVIANDIFEFVKGLVLLPHKWYIEKFGITNIYKNWGEDFWRIRADKSE